MGGGRQIRSSCILHMLPQFTIHHKLCTDPCSQKTLNYFFSTFTHTSMALGLFELHQNIHFCNILDKFVDQNNPLIFNPVCGPGEGFSERLGSKEKCWRKFSSDALQYGTEHVYEVFSPFAIFKSLGSLFLVLRRAIRYLISSCKLS